MKYIYFMGEQIIPSVLLGLHILEKLGENRGLLMDSRIFDSSLSMGQFEENGIANSSLKFEYEWLDTNQAAAYLKLPVGTLRNMTSNGKIPYYKCGRKNLYRMEELRKLLLSSRRGVLDEF